MARDTRNAKITNHPLASKDQVLEIFKNFVSRVERSTGKKVQRLRSDRGGEYTSYEFDEYLAEKGIERNLTVGYSPNQNGVAERLNRTLNEKTTAMIHASQMDDASWAEAMVTASYVRNRSPVEILGNRTPKEIWSGRRPTVKHLRVFGCLAAVKIEKVHRSTKLDSKN